ncbi:Ger(x)C family spore germination protein [Mesobacillus maritimus]|uniref:Ger(X)C family spore germination protein n=1 Tax=Mesobacillus maritimus TaxID=1643336 RepID=A0ABS7K7G8_9BACI|nr:Ger(x)C family spore germination protein [Mesobacillus maritimus]MBY0098216.1 Ger(x)C family spore germination protein [Mesobacillus maritimus]
MKKTKKHLIFFFILVCIVSLLGCNRTRIIDKISIVHVFGFDQADNGELVGTALFPQYTKSKSSDQIEYLEEQASSSVLFVPKMAAHTSTPVELSKIRVLLFGKKYAEAGIQDMVDRFMTTPQLGTNIHIAVSTHSARETLNTFKKEKSLTLADRIEHNMQGQSLPTMNLHVFLNHFYGEGMDAYVPMINIDEKDMVSVEGMGVFKGDKFKLQLDSEQTALFSILEDYRSQATFKIPLDERNRSEIIIIKAFRSKSKWDWNPKKKQMNLRLQLEMTMSQHPRKYNLEKVQEINKIKKLIGTNLEKGIRDLLLTFKEYEVDPLGIGNIVRSKDRNWDEASFYQLYPTLPIHVDVNLQIIHSGLES